MSDKPENPPAFPENGRDGMTLRDYFAGQALAGLCASLAHPDYVANSAKKPEPMAEDAFAIADTMLAERAKTK